MVHPSHSVKCYAAIRKNEEMLMFWLGTMVTLCEHVGKRVSVTRDITTHTDSPGALPG